MDFRKLPSQAFTLGNVTVPGCFLNQSGELKNTDLGIQDGVVTDPVGEYVDMRGAMVLPAFVDMHTHLDKGHILPRASNPDGSFLGALQTVRVDHANWSATDVYKRADFSLRCAYAHGTRAIRSHLDCAAPQDEISWPVFNELKMQWSGKIELQGVCLVGCEDVDLYGRFQQTVDIVQRYEGVLGVVTYPMKGLDKFLPEFFSIASERGLDVDMHVDETLVPDVNTLRSICRAVLDTKFENKVTVGHVCSLSAQTEKHALDTLDLVARAGISVVSLPMCNLYLQDRSLKRTPRMRGVTLVHEMKERGIAVSFASDNTRDPFYAYGDLDMLEVLREATRIAHLDHSDPDWIEAFTSLPASVCGFTPTSLQKNAPADLVVCRARNWPELLSRPQTDRIVIRDGQVIDRTLPDYSELDDLF